MPLDREYYRLLVSPSLMLHYDVDLGSLEIVLSCCCLLQSLLKTSCSTVILVLVAQQNSVFTPRVWNGVVSFQKGSLNEGEQ